MNTTITLDKKHYQAASKTARKLGTTPEAYIASLIDHANRTFDDILAPARQAFASTSNEELDSLFKEANTAARKRLRARK